MTTELGPNVPTYEFVKGIETLRHIPNLQHGNAITNAAADGGAAVAIKVPNDDVDHPTLKHSITYPQLHDLIEQTATALVHVAKIEKGDIIAIAMPNNIEFILTFLAVPWTRAVSAPLNPQYTENEFKYYMEDNQSKCLLVPSGDEERIPEAEAAATTLGLPIYFVHWDSGTNTVTLTQKGGEEKNSTSDDDQITTKLIFDPQPEDVALFLHTSGTTARPKVRHKEETTP
jgi:acyl-CoA synthetase (AMP-forming)/AMP-acid ligase II